jgi:nucleoside-triphosphatase
LSLYSATYLEEREDMSRRIFLTGRPGIGKTSVLLRVIKILQDERLLVGGILSHEVRQGASRVGFRLIDITNGREGWLAHIHHESGPSVGKYRVNLHDLHHIGVRAILSAIDTVDVIVIDEIGPMELFSSAFKEAVTRAMESPKILIGVLHYRVRDPLISTIRTIPHIQIFEVTLTNRQHLHKTIIHMIKTLSHETT